MKREFDDIQKELNQVMNYVDGMVKNLDEAINIRMEQERALINSKAKWESVQIYWPKRIGKRWYWLGDTAYRRAEHTKEGLKFKYGTEFDVLKDSDKK